MNNMMNQCGRFSRVAIAASLLAAACAVQAELTPQELQRLGKDLTPIGAERSGNADGSIPSWEGGLITPPAGFDKTKDYVNPFASEKPLFTVTAANLAQYQALLAPGQIELLKRYGEYKMKVYPTHRTAGHAAWYHDAIRSLSPKARLTPGNLGVQGIDKAPIVPFPVPKSGAEVIENHNLRYRADAVMMDFIVGSTQPNGAFTPVKWRYEVAYAARMPDAEPNRLLYFKQTTLSPSNSAGEATVTIDMVDKSIEPRQAWTYNPGQRRVLRAPDLGYDTPYFNVDGLATIDDSDMYNGALDRFEWKLLGKKEMLIAYNCYELASHKLKYTDIFKPGVPNQDLVRYEKHRVWVVEGTLKPGARHIYARRVFYVDEDSWQIAHGDKYDARGGLWRVHEGYMTQNYEVPAPWYAGAVQHDLQARRYFFERFNNEEKMPVYNVFKPRSNFSSDSLRRSGN